MRLIFGFVSVLLGLVPPVFLYAADIQNPPFTDSSPYNLTRGYNTPATHVGREGYALDFAQSGCAAFDDSVIAVASGEVFKVNATDRTKPSGGGGFGLFVLIKHADGAQSRYAHLDRVFVTSGHVEAGQEIGLVGNTGNVSGASCPDYPGTHLHFVMYNADGTAYQPEPMQRCLEMKSKTSPCTNFLAGLWYLSEPLNLKPETLNDQEISFQTSSDSTDPAEVTFLYPNNFFEEVWWFFRDGALATWDGVTALFGSDQEANLLASLPFDDGAAIDVQEGGYANAESDTVPVLAVNEAPTSETTASDSNTRSSEQAPSSGIPSTQEPAPQSEPPPETATDSPDSTPVPPQEAGGDQQEPASQDSQPAETPPPPPQNPFQPHNDNGWNAGGFYGPADHSTAQRGDSSITPALFALSTQEDTEVSPDTTVIAYEPGSDTFLAAWARRYTSQPGIYDIVGQRFGGNGALLDEQPFVIASPQMRQPIGLQLVAGHGMFFLVWYSGYSGETETPMWYKSAAARISPDGTVLDLDGFHISDQNGTACSSQPVAATIGDGFLVLCYQSYSSGGVSGGATDIFGTHVSTEGDVSPIRSFASIQPFAGGPFQLICNTSDFCVFSSGWRGHSLLIPFTVSDFLSDLWRTPIFRGCATGDPRCVLPMIWQSGLGISLQTLADGAFEASWEWIDSWDGTRKGIAFQRIAARGILEGEPVFIEDSISWRAPQFGDAEHLFYHTEVAYRLGITILPDTVSVSLPPELLSQDADATIWTPISAACGIHACAALWTSIGSDNMWKLTAWTGPR